MISSRVIINSIINMLRAKNTCTYDKQTNMKT